MLDDKLLIWRFNHGDREALCLIYDRYKHDLLALAMHLLNDVSASEDVIHDVFVAFIKSRQKFRLTGSLKGYLATCVANRARNENRDQFRHSANSLEENHLDLSSNNDPETNIVFNERFFRLNNALTQLPYEQREVILLRIQSDMTFKQIAEIQETSINTVQGRYRYGLDKLRTILNNKVSHDI